MAKTYVGEEAIATGVCAHLGPADPVFSTHRGHGHALAKGVSPEEVLSTGRFCVGTPDECIEVVENYERMGADEIMPIFQAGPATDAEVKNSLRLFGKYVIPHFKK